MIGGYLHSLRTLLDTYLNYMYCTLFFLTDTNTYPYHAWTSSDENPSCGEPNEGTFVRRLQRSVSTLGTSTVIAPLLHI